MSEAAIGGALQEKLFLEIGRTHRKPPAPESLFNKACNFIEKETLPQVYTSEFCQISKNTFFTEHLLATASAVCFMILRPIF